MLVAGSEHWCSEPAPEAFDYRPDGYAVMCTDGEDDQFLAGITPEGAPARCHLS